jgi:predicted 3-demethylubiquinone-9 3-methyltransferase (glyoxalase superfamily)
VTAPGFPLLNRKSSRPVFKESISCKDQNEIDYYWGKLTADGGEESVCGWLKDKYGISWQVAPANMEELMKKPDAFKTMMQQKKIIIAEY